MKRHALIEEYNRLNIHGVYPPTVWDTRYFTQDDQKANGDKKIQSANYRRRLKRMMHELQERIDYLRMPEPIYFAEFEPIFDFTLEDEADIQKCARTNSESNSSAN